MILAGIVSTVGILGWILIGGLAGAVAGRVVEGRGFGILGDILLGIIGAVIGGLILGLIVTAQVGLIGSLITAFLGAVILLWLVRLVSGNRARIYVSPLRC